MRHWKKRFFAAGLALSLLTGQAALASEALGHDLHEHTTALSQGTSVTRGYFWSDTYSDLRTERYVTYTPNDAVRPTVAYGDYVLQRATLSAMAKKLEEQGKRVVGGTNGDFYVLATGQPLGLVVTDGVLRSSSSYLYAVGFRADGTAFVGQPSLRVTATMNGERLNVSGGINKVRQLTGKDNGGLMLLTEDFAADTQNTSAGVDVILRVLTDQVGAEIPQEESGAGQPLTVTDKPRIGGRLQCEVDYITEASGANPIPAGYVVLTMNGKDNEEVLTKLRALQPGDPVTIDVSSQDTRWNEAVEAVGGMYRLLENGQMGSNLSTERTARTAIGVKEDGTVLFYTIDGKQPGYSVGATCAQVAQRLQELGCVDALGLDGGGSTTLGVTYPDQSAMGVVNKPADGVQRPNSNAIFLTTDLKATGEPAYLALTPGEGILLAGASVQFDASVVDTAWYGMGGAGGVTYSATGAGTVTAEGRFTAQGSGQAVVTGVSGALQGTAELTVVETPDRISVADEATGKTVTSLALDPEEKLSLTADSWWRNLSLTDQDGCYTWACDPAVGTVTPEGDFTAAAEGGSGSLTVTAGSRTATIPVTVASHVRVVEDMEGAIPGFVSTEGVTAVQETVLSNVRAGSKSLRLEYDTGTGGTARLEADVTIPTGEKYLGLWVRGDGTTNSLTLEVADGTGKTSLVGVTGLSQADWKHVLVPLPAGAVKLTGLQVVYGGGEKTSGAIWLDHLTSSNEAIEDFTAPVIQLEVSGRTVTASISDNVDQELPASAVKLTCDGWKMDMTWSAPSGKLTATLPEGGTGSRRVTVTAVDASGNIGRASRDLPGTEQVAFADMEDHWAAEFAGYLYQQGVTRGTAEGETLYYQPDTNITRAEFFTMVARWLRLDLTKYETVELPFADTGAIPEWALSAVKAVYAEGMVQGSLESDGLYAYPSSTLTRAEAMTILGRTQMRGYREAELASFSDAAQVPEWARSYVGSLVGQGVVNGYDDGSLRPGDSMTRGQVAKVLTVLR